MNHEPKNGYPSFCWHCGKQLQLMRGDIVAFILIEDKIKSQHRIHYDCWEFEVSKDRDFKKIGDYKSNGQNKN